ncbi:MAG TPA: hypothetical protein VHJ77_19825 [Vicinamibacterales bacterium]|jgi:hypothetical protein|nr:hypothetical protein [Vicinamibacterales bacterium]
MTWAAALAAGLLVVMLALQEVGRRLGVRRLARDPEGKISGGAAEAGIFGLLGLLIAFTFSGAGSRFDDRRQLVIEEANNIGTAWLRLDLLPAERQPALRDLFRRYLDSRLETYRKVPDMTAARAELTRSTELQRKIWAEAVAASQSSTTTAPAMLLLPALNQMIDITTTRTITAEIHPPAIVFIMLVLLACIAALLAGYGMAGGKSRSWIHANALAIVIAATVYVIIDYEYPRLGFIRVDAVDHALEDLRRDMQ